MFDINVFKKAEFWVGLCKLYGSWSFSFGKMYNFARQNLYKLTDIHLTQGIGFRCGNPDKITNLVIPVFAIGERSASMRIPSKKHSIRSSYDQAICIVSGICYKRCNKPFSPVVTFTSDKLFFYI